MYKNRSALVILVTESLEARNPNTIREFMNWFVEETTKLFMKYPYVDQSLSALGALDEDEP